MTIVNVNFSTYEENPCFELQEVLEIDTTVETLNEIYRHLSIDYSTFENIIPTPHMMSIARYEAFLKELKKRGISYNIIKPVCFLF